MTTLITGSTHGLGYELALEFSKHGHDIIIHGRDVKAAVKLKDEIEANGGGAFTVIGDIRDKRTQENLKWAAEDDIGILINNAAQLSTYKSFEKTTDEEIAEMMDTNLTAVVRVTRDLYPILKKNCGTIININSDLAMKPAAKRSIYCASKWGLKGFTDSLREGARKDKVRVMGVYIWMMRTRSWLFMGKSPKIVARNIYKAYAEGGDDDLVV
jgi:short-subunit dehydrogenase